MSTEHEYPLNLLKLVAFSSFSKTTTLVGEKKEISAFQSKLINIFNRNKASRNMTETNKKTEKI